MSGKALSPTIADVAREAGVSISTVSRFLNESSLVADHTVERIRDAIQRLGYLPRSAARNLALRRTNTLGVMIESIGSSFTASVVAGAEEAAYAEGYSLLIATPNHLRNGNLPALGPFNTDGLLLVNIAMKKSAFSYYQDGYPIISLYTPAPRSLHIPLVSVENKRGTFQLVEHLIVAHGFTRIGFLRGPKGNNDSHWREVGFRQAMKKHGLPVDESLVGYGGFAFPYARKAILEWGTQGRLPQAIFTGNDDAALDAMLTLNRMGLRVPQDVAVVGFDDSYLAPSMVPPLTTVRAPTQAVGATGVRALIQLIQTGQADPLTLLPTELVIRSSCGCANALDADTWPDHSVFAHSRTSAVPIA